MTDEKRPDQEEEQFDGDALVFVEDIVMLFTYEIPDQEDLFAETWRVHINRRMPRSMIPSVVDQIKAAYAADPLYQFKWHSNEMILH